MFTGEYKFIALIEDGDPRCDKAIRPLRGKLDNLQRGIEGVAGVNFFQEFAGKLSESNEHFADVVGK